MIYLHFFVQSLYFVKYIQKTLFIFVDILQL